MWLYDHKSRHRNLLFEENNLRYQNATNSEQTSTVCTTLKLMYYAHSCTVDVAITRDHKFITINSNTRTSSEVFSNLLYRQFYITVSIAYIGAYPES